MEVLRIDSDVKITECVVLSEHIQLNTREDFQLYRKLQVCSKISYVRPHDYLIFGKEMGTHPLNVSPYLICHDFYDNKRLVVWFVDHGLPSTSGTVQFIFNKKGEEMKTVSYTGICFVSVYEKDREVQVPYTSYMKEAKKHGYTLDMKFGVVTGEGVIIGYIKDGEVQIKTPLYVCHVCDNPSDRICPCRKVRYCGKKCFKEDWNNHRKVCLKKK